MAYQSLNIIGSFTAATPIVGQQIAADKERADAYRNMLREQVRRPNPAERNSEGPSEIAETSDRMTIGDHPEENRNPYLFRQRDDKNENGEESPVTEMTDDPSPPLDHIDTVI